MCVPVEERGIKEASEAEISAEQRRWLLRSATYASMGVATLLIAIKAFAWWFGGSVSVLASLADSLMDSLASLLNLLAVRYAMQPADDDHRFGHGKAEFLAGLGQALFIGGSALFLGWQAVDRLLHPQPLDELGVSIGVMGVSIVATALLLMWQTHVVKHTQSVAIRADRLHYASDLVSNAGVILALGLAAMGFEFLDPVFAMGIALMIGYSAVKIALESIDHLLDRELPFEVEQRIQGIAMGCNGVMGVHGIRTRQSGHVKVIQMHLEMDGEMRLRDSHKIAVQVERDLRKVFQGADIIIHQDPRPNLDDG
ncbi:Cation efflux protein [gamma proteobacterium HdN1]|nr:Cation efflux protein [gamma proteobacterium HdN1]